MNAIRSRIEAIEADITTLPLDAIVNAANAALIPGGGVDGAIRRKAGHELNQALFKIGSCPEGQAVVTEGYRLPAKHVIHTVAPIFGRGTDRSVQDVTLSRCYENALKLADTSGIRTVAFPAIGTGAYRWPPDIACQIAFAAVVAHLRECEMQEKVTFCCFSRVDRELYGALIAGLSE